MHDSTQAKPNELNQDDSRYGFRCCHLKIFFFNDTATTEIYTLSLHDALPICGFAAAALLAAVLVVREASPPAAPRYLDRKSTRLNSSHLGISYAVFCLKKKTNELNQDDARYGFRCCHLKNIWTSPLAP